MLNLKKSTFCLIVLFLLCLPLEAFPNDNDGCLDCPTIPENIPNYFLRWEILPETIDPDSQELVAVAGRLPPFSWSFTGTGFSLEYTEGATNTLYADPDACGVAEITVTDNSGNQIVGEVRCSNGAWGTPVDGCILPGEGTASTPSIGYFIKGKYKQTQHTTNLSGSYFHWGECSTIERCDEDCASNPDCDPDYGCEPCLYLDQNKIPCVNDGYAGVDCPPSCRAWCICTTELYYQEWVCD